jgi:cyclohexanone monooxygenase
MLEEQARHVSYIVQRLLNEGVTRMEVAAESEEEWVQRIISLAQNNVKFLESCTPGYYNNEGKPAARSVQSGSYGAGPVAFIKVLEDWRSQDQLTGLETS